MSKIIIGATSDIHAPKSLDLYIQALKVAVPQLKACDLFLLAGDLIFKGSVSEIHKVIAPLNEYSFPIISVFGNEEYRQYWEEIKAETEKKVRYLTEESIILNIKEKSIGIVGSQGSLDQPTPWQRNNIPNICEIYSNRIQRVEALLKEMKTDFKILLLHHPPTYKTLKGEPPRSFPFLGSRRMGRAVFKTGGIDLVIHGHAHKGSTFAYEESTPVFNVALPLRKRLVFTLLPRRSSLNSFL